MVKCVKNMMHFIETFIILYGVLFLDMANYFLQLQATADIGYYCNRLLLDDVSYFNFLKY